MFYVRCSPRLPRQSAQLRAPPCARAHPPPPDRSPPPGPQPAPHHVCPACDPRQAAQAFNQVLDWHTSSVTDMSWMFEVRCSPRTRPLTICTHAPPTLRAARVHRDRARTYACCLRPPVGCTPHRTPPLRMCPSFASAGDRGWPAHLLRKPQPTSNRSPQSLSVGGRALSSLRLYRVRAQT